ncbi:hypothetical protein BDV95DRAFT_263697 [Massariosphaeria phaeospora]|uniref:Uncharacterized protein n=1 Tax=Massariosphaeria phaeospora TaxID=100035 RepID=A0A7C8I2H7_9PLEO|nr:hypothetical protein BDV95DRAFT_263697 [Massariosphaeria phaeospora]
MSATGLFLRCTFHSKPNLHTPSPRTLASPPNLRTSPVRLLRRRLSIEPLDPCPYPYSHPHPYPQGYNYTQAKILEAKDKLRASLSRKYDDPSIANQICEKLPNDKSILEGIVEDVEAAEERRTKKVENSVMFGSVMLLLGSVIGWYWPKEDVAETLNDE